jgi:hypothetical protein
MSRRVGEIDRWHERLKLFSGGKLVVHRCDPWKHGEILHVISKKNGVVRVYVGKYSCNRDLIYKNRIFNFENFCSCFPLSSYFAKSSSYILSCFGM